MGAHSELDTEISVKINSSELDELIDLFESDEIFAPAVEMAQRFKNGIEEGSHTGSFKVADKNRSLQELAIAMHGNIHHHRLINSIKDIEQIDDYTWLVGTNIEHFYPLCIEKGRREVVPIRAKMLHWFTQSGKEVFAKRSSATQPSPFVEPAFNQTQDIAAEIIMGEIANATQ